MREKAKGSGWIEQDYFELACSKSIETALEVATGVFRRSKWGQRLHHYLCGCVWVNNEIGGQLLQMELFPHRAVIYKLARRSDGLAPPVAAPVRSAQASCHHFHLLRPGLSLPFQLSLSFRGRIRRGLITVTVHRPSVSGKPASHCVPMSPSHVSPEKMNPFQWSSSRLMELPKLKKKKKEKTWGWKEGNSIRAFKSPKSNGKVIDALFLAARLSSEKGKAMI